MASLDFNMVLDVAPRKIQVRVLAETRRVRGSVEIRQLVVQNSGFSLALPAEMEDMVRDEVKRRGAK